MSGARRTRIVVVVVTTMLIALLEPVGAPFGGRMVSVAESAPAETLSVGIARNADDGEEAADGSMSLYSSDLEMVDDGGPQTVGMRFTDITIPQGATILSAYITFTANESQSEPTTLTLAAHATASAPAFTNTTANLSSRPRTDATVTWADLPPWTRGQTHQSPELAPIIDELITATTWQPGNDIAIIVTGTGHRTADSREKSRTRNPILTITYAP